MSRVWPLCALLFVLLTPLATHAQRRARREAWVAPVEPQILSTSEGPASRYQIVLALRVTGDVEVITDPHAFSIEIAERTEAIAGRRARRPRTHRCASSGPRPRGLSPVAMHAGDAWGVALDLRSLCWGRALAAIEAGGAVSVHYGVGRGGRGAFVARNAAGSTRELVASSTFALPAVASASGSSVVTVAPVDARSARGITLRVAVFGPDAATRRAWLRPDRVRFRVVDPRGQAWDCRLPPTGAAPIPDLFSRISSRRPARFSLDASQYCPEETFEHAGVYEVTPVVELDEDGAEWELNALVGTYAGRAVPVRVRSGEGALYRVLGAEDLRRLVH